MKGRESKAKNNMFFTCSLIENIARVTNNKNKDIANFLGEKGLNYILKNAQVLHCENINKITDEIILKYGIKKGEYYIDKYEEIPSYFDMGKVFSRLIYFKISKDHEKKTKSILKIYNSPITELINNYDVQMMLSNTQYLYESYKAKQPLVF